MNDVLFRLEHQTYGPLESCARFHHRLTLIHPFPNGNGRYGRIHTNLLFDRYKVKRPSWGLQLEPAKRRKIYIDALRKADQQNIDALMDFLKN